MKKWTALLLSLLMLVGLAVPALAQDELSGEITMWHSFVQGARMEAVQKAAEEFMRLHPKVKINIETYAWGDFNTKWNAGLMTGDLPDISTAQGAGEVVEMLNADVLMPVDELVEAVGRDRFAKKALDDMSKDGKNYAVPYYSHAQVMWYRSDLLEAAGLEVPRTWEEFAAAAKALTKDGVYGASVPMSTNDLLSARYLNYYVRSKGQSLLNEDLTPNLTGEAAVEGIKFWLDIYQNCSPKESINFTVNDHAKLFYQGLTAFDFNSGFMVSGVAGNRPDLLPYVKCAMLPRADKADAEYGAETSHIPLVMWKKAKSPEAARAFIAYLFEEKNYIPFLDAVPVGMLPALSDVVESEAYLKNEMVQQFKDEIAVISKAIGMAGSIGFERGATVQASYLTSQHVIEAMFQDIVTNGTAVETAAQNAQDRLTEIFQTMINQ